MYLFSTPSSQVSFLLFIIVRLMNESCYPCPGTNWCNSYSWRYSRSVRWFSRPTLDTIFRRFFTSEELICTTFVWNIHQSDWYSEINRSLTQFLLYITKIDYQNGILSRPEYYGFFLSGSKLFLLSLID